jgi:dual specificity tyrosine-phosphorylation-regulated kinase 2/3/4
LDFDHVYFIGHKAHKVRLGPVSNQSNLTLFDNKNNEYKYVINDHIAYRYELLETIGRGAFGQVIKVFDHKRKTLGALKIIRNKDNFSKQALVELKILRYIRDKDVRGCANIVRVKDFVVFRNHVVQLATNLVYHLRAARYEPVRFHEEKPFSGIYLRPHPQADCTNTPISYVSISRKCNVIQHKIIHCDVKPENIVLKQPGKSGVRMIDFGTSCF